MYYRNTGMFMGIYLYCNKKALYIVLSFLFKKTLYLYFDFS